MLGLISEAFLEQTASQLTYHGLCELNAKLQDDQLCVFFRNNHFSTFHKHKVRESYCKIPSALFCLDLTSCSTCNFKLTGKSSTTLTILFEHCNH